MSDLPDPGEIRDRIERMQIEDEDTLFRFASMNQTHGYGEHQRAYAEARDFNDGGLSFYALVMATMKRADTFNAIRLRRAFPEVWLEMQDRYDAPGGILPHERMNYPETDPTPETT